MVKHNSYFNSENQPFQRIIVYQADGQTKVGCSCCCYAEVRSVTASLSHVGYLPFTCEGSEPPPTDTRYLKYRASGDGYIEACGVAPQHQNVIQEWTVDPFTGLTCYNGPEADIVSSGCSELQNCSATQKSYSCAGDENNPCTQASINWTESLQDSYTIEDVASNVDTMLGRINPYGNDGMPAGTRGSVVNGTNGSILTWVNECALNRAEYISGAGGVTKTKLFVKFTKHTQYTLTQSNGSVQTLTATEGQQIIVETPSEPNTWTDIAIVNKTKVGCCNSSIGATTHTGETTDSTFVADGGQFPCYHIGPDCKKYLKEEEISEYVGSCEGSNSSNEDFGGGKVASVSGTSSGTSSTKITETRECGQRNIVNVEYSAGFESSSNYKSNGFSYDYETDEWYKSIDVEQNYLCSSTYIDGIQSGSTTGNIITTNYYKNEGGGISSYTTNQPVDFETIKCGECGSNSGSPEPLPYDLANCSSYDWQGENTTRNKTTTISDTEVKVEVSMAFNISNQSSSSSGDYSETSSSNYSQTGSVTITTTYSNEYISKDQYQNGTWEDETSPNESLCASRTESETTKQSKNVAASVELTFTAPTSESPITYEHWFHYYTVEVDSSEEGCPTSDVVAHNEKWTSVSSGGVLTLSRNINLSTPPKNHSICAQSLAFVTRVAS